MSLISVTGYWYPNQSTEMLPPDKPIRSPRLLAEDILDEINEVHPFSKDPFLIGKVKNYVHTKKYYDCNPNNQMGALFYRKCKRAISNHIILQPEVFKLGEEDFKLSSRDLRAYISRTNVPSQECYVFGEQAIINSVGERLREQTNAKKVVRIDQQGTKQKDNDGRTSSRAHPNRVEKAFGNSAKEKESKLHKSGIDGSWSFDKSDFKRTKCCEEKMTANENKAKVETTPTKSCSILKPQKLLGLGEKSNDYAYPICPRGTAAIILKTYSTYNIKWQFRSKYVTLGVQKKRKRKTKWSAREWAWFMRRRSKKMERKHLKKLLRKRQKQFAKVDPSKKRSSETNSVMSKRRRSSKVTTKLHRLKTKLFRLKKKQKNKLTKITLLTKGLFSSKNPKTKEEEDESEDEESDEARTISATITEEVVNGEEKKTTEGHAANIDKTVTAMKSFSKITRGIPKIKTTKSKTIKAVKKYSIDSLPDFPDIDIFDRNKTPDPKAPATLIHQLKNGDSSSESYNVIEKYYASKNAEKSDEDEEEEQEDDLDTKDNLDENYEFSTKTDESKRNAILFPDMTQEEIDAKIMKICENSDKWKCYVKSYLKLKQTSPDFSLDLMLRGLLHPSDYKEILFRVSQQPKVTYGDEKSLSYMARKQQEIRLGELRKKIKAKKVSQKFGIQNKLAMAKDVITTVKTLSYGAKDKHSTSSAEGNPESNSFRKVKNVTKVVSALKNGTTCK